VIAVDDRPATERTLAYVSRVMSGRADVEIGLAHLIASDDDSTATAGEVARETLVAHGLARGQVQASVVPRHPDLDIAEQLIEYTKQAGAGTLVVGWDTYSHLTELFHRHLGEELAARARDVNLWIVRGEAEAGDDLGILVAVDESDASRDTIAYVARMLEGCHGVRVHLFGALEPVAPSPSDYAADDESTSTQQLLDEAVRERLARAHDQTTALLESARARLHEDGLAPDRITIECSETFVSAQAVPDTIAKAAGAASCTTVVVGCHALSWYERLFRHHVGAELLDTTHDLTVWIAA
jgi:K+-sensing histidine kinase KdpD